MVFAVSKWQHYLMSMSFVIRTDPQSLKHVLEHKLTTPFQQKWLSKLAGFDYVVEYKSGKDNIIADALSRTPGAQLLTIAASMVNSQLMDKLKKNWLEDPQLHKLIDEVSIDNSTHPQCKWHNDMLLRKEKLVVGDNSDLHQVILDWMHNSCHGGHSGVYATLKRIQTLFYWPMMRETVVKFI